jgi:hypothetical protein
MNKRDLVAEIIRSKEYLTLLPGWDDDGAEPISEDAWGHAVVALIQLFGGCSGPAWESLRAPILGLCPDGTLDIYWSEGPAELLVNVGADGIRDVSASQNIPHEIQERLDALSAHREFDILSSLTEEEYNALPHISEEEFQAAMGQPEPAYGVVCDPDGRFR